MRSRYKTPRRMLLLGALAVCAFSAVGTASASATTGQYWVGGSAFTGTESVSAKLPAGQSFIWHASFAGGYTAEIVCTGVSVTTGSIFGNFKGSAKALTFTGCSLIRPCGTLSSTTIKTEELESSFGVSEETVYESFKAKAPNTTIAKITVTGCAFEGTYTIRGSASAIEKHPGTEAVEKELEFTSTSGTELTLAGEPMTVYGTTLFSLSGANSGKKWTAKL